LTFLLTLFALTNEPMMFVARCYASVADVVMQCTPVRLSVTFVKSVKTSKHIYRIFSPSGSHTILVLPYLLTSWQTWSIVRPFCNSRAYCQINQLSWHIKLMAPADVLCGTTVTAVVMLLYVYLLSTVSIDCLEISLN